MTLDHGSSEMDLSTDTDASGAFEIWPQMVEEAYAKLMNGGGAPDYSKIWALSVKDAAQALTGNHMLGDISDVATIADLNRIFSICQGIFKGPAFVVAATLPSFGSATSVVSSNGYKIYPDHAYVVESWSTATGLVCLRNPWGDLTSDKFQGRGVIYVTMADFKKYFNLLQFGSTS